MPPLHSTHDLLVQLTSRNESRAEAAACLLAKHGDSILPALGKLLESPDADQRWWAVRTLAAMREPCREWLSRSLEDPSSEVRAAAALAIAAHPDPAACAGLVECLNDEDNVVAVLAVNALVSIGSPAIPTLLEAYDGATSRARIQIMRAVAEIRDPRAIALMMKAMDQDSAAAHYWAQQGLEMLGLNMVYLRPE